MRVFVIGKVGNITHWVEDAVAGFRLAGHDVALGVSRNPAFGRRVARWMLPLRPGWIEGAIRRFRPDLILALSPYVMPRAILERVGAMPGRPPLVGWEGDVFAEADRPIADLFDLVAYTDSALLPRHAALGFKAATLFVPHAATARPIDRVPAAASRRARLVFVASVTPRRRVMVGGMAQPISLYGPGWRGLTQGGHDIHAKRISDTRLAALYPRYLAALNIPNETNVLGGLNQRNFTPCLSATPVLTEAQADLEYCFEPGREALVYRDRAELDDWHARLLRDPAFADSIGQRGRVRVLGTHSYALRLETLARAIGSKKALLF